MTIEFNEDMYKELLDYIDIFDGCYVENIEVQCFQLIKGFIDNNIDLDYVSLEKINLIKKQLEESFKWLDEINIKINYRDDFMSYFE